MDLQFLTIIVFSILAGVYIITLIERKKNRDREAEILRNVPGTINRRCEFEDINISWTCYKRPDRMIWEGIVNESKCFSILSPANSNKYQLWMFVSEMQIALHNHETLDGASDEAAKVINYINYVLNGD